MFLQEWHTDGPHARKAALSNAAQLRTPPQTLCVFVPLQDLSACPDMGCTQFWPGTHQCAHLLGFGPAAAELQCTVDALAHAGDGIVYDYRTMHRGLPNASHQQRDVLQFVYSNQVQSQAHDGPNYRGPSLYA